MSRPRPFLSHLRKDLADYLALKRALGRKLLNDERVLRHLDRFLSHQFRGVRELSVPVIEAWMSRSPDLKPQSRAVRLRVVRQFCLYVRRRKPTTFVPDRIQHRTLWPVRVSRHLPFIFTTQQIQSVLRAAMALPMRPGNRARPRTIFTLMLLLYAAGLRRAEAVGLRIGDVDFDEGTLIIRETKFFKTRLVPIAPDVLRQVRRHVRGLAAKERGGERPLFQHHGRAYSASAVGQLGRELLRRCGLKPVLGRGGARVHDFRHSFAVHRITRWYEAGQDVQSLLPGLATYMGHKDIASTQYYATVTAEILEHAGRRFERACAPKGGR